MKTWSYGTNNLYKTCSVWLEEAPWWIWLLLEVSPRICSAVPRLPIPFVNRIKIMREGEEYTWGGWYGDDLKTLWHSFIDFPLFEWAYKRVKITTVPVTWEQGFALFGREDPFSDDTPSV